MKDKEQIMQSIIKKQDEIIELFWQSIVSADLIMPYNAIKYKDELADLKRELKEYKNDEWDNLEDFNQPLDKPIEL